MKDIVIIGSGGFGREVAWLIDEINKVEDTWNLLGFIDDNHSVQGTEVNGVKVLGGTDWLMDKSINVVCAIGDPVIKKKVLSELESTNNTFPVLIDPLVRYSQTVEFGEGSIICAENTLTTNIKVGKHVIINLDCTIGHDATIGDYSTILPSVNVSGETLIGECVSMGTSSSIIQGVSIGENTVVGAGAVVVKDLPANCTAVGAPAKAIKFH
ncbi:transferase [Tetzosporium hominis]|uniref:Transferase n=1 Tax=Tetzosporium hominis TaxID=2020506 RepID=A0A264W047_9BACL|nr:acetyltransferase [Tetzosporium hominis]OZS76950.1 transferase [Tetzosporium hominis]